MTLPSYYDGSPRYAIGYQNPAGEIYTIREVTVGSYQYRELRPDFEDAASAGTRVSVLFFNSSGGAARGIERFPGDIQAGWEFELGRSLDLPEGRETVLANLKVVTIWPRLTL